MPKNLEKVFRLGACEIRPGEHCIVNAGQLNHVEPKSMAVLVELASKSRETVSREELISAVWPRGFVSDDVLSRCVSQLRTALGDNSKSPTFIATVPRKGYRLLAEVELQQSEALAGVLVLPFQLLAEHGKDEYLANGLTELLIARLAVVLDQRVISRTTAMSYKGKDPKISELRDQLGIQWVIEGSLLQLDGQLQVIVQLIDVKEDAHAWAETWTRPTKDIMSVLNEVSRQISTQINTRLEAVPKSPQETVPLRGELMHRYLQGVHHASKRATPSLRQAMACFQDVLTEHTDHSSALAGMAMCHMLLVHYGAEPAAKDIPKARKYAQKALEIDPLNADAMSHLGAVYFFYDWEFQKAGELANSALQIKPNLEMALILAANVDLVSGRYEKSQAWVDQAIAIDPLNIGVLMNAGDILILQRRYGEAIRCLRQALELEPRFRPAYLRLALALALNKEHVLAWEVLQKTLTLGGEDAAYHEYRALLAGKAGDSDKAIQSVNALRKMALKEKPVLPWSLARACVAAEDFDSAISSLKKAFETHSSSMPFLGQTPIFESIRSHPEVQALIKKTGLPV